jgi:hypothetical protein
MPPKLTEEIRGILTRGEPADLVTLNPDGSQQVSVVWIGLQGDEIICPHRRVAQDPQYPPRPRGRLVHRYRSVAPGRARRLPRDHRHRTNQPGRRLAAPASASGRVYRSRHGTPVDPGASSRPCHLHHDRTHHPARSAGLVQADPSQTVPGERAGNFTVGSPTRPRSQRDHPATKAHEGTSIMTPASRALTSARNRAQPVAAAPAEGRSGTAGRAIADLPADRDSMLIAAQNLRAAQDKSPEPPGSPAA